MENPLFESTSQDGWIEAPVGRPTLQDPMPLMRLFTRSWGEDPRAPGVAIVHGLGDHSGRWERVGRTLADRGFAAYALDLPGHGRSEGPRGHVNSWDDYREAMRCWTSTIRGNEPARPWALFGHSMGALITLDAVGLPWGAADALVLSAPPFELSLRPDAARVHAARIVGMLWPGFTQGNQIPPSLLSHDPEVIRAHRADPYVHFRISAKLFLEFQSVRARLAKCAPSISMPTLLIQGGADPVASPLGSARWAREARPGVVTYREYPGLFHEVLNEPEGAAILDGVITWLEGTLVNGRGPRPA